MIPFSIGSLYTLSHRSALSKGASELRMAVIPVGFLKLAISALVTRCDKAALPGSQMKFGNKHSAALLWMLLLPHLFLKFSEKEHGDGTRRFKHGSLHLNIYFLSRHGYFALYDAIVLFGLPLQVIVVEVWRGGEVSVLRLHNYHSTWSLIISAYFEVTWVSAKSAPQTWWGIGVVVRGKIIFLLFSLVDFRRSWGCGRANNQ